MARNHRCCFRRHPMMALLVTLGLSWASVAMAFDTLLRIGSGSEGGTYFPIANLIATALTEGDCPGCGVPGLLVAAQVSNGSVANVRDLRAGHLEAGLVQADVAFNAYTGAGQFQDRPPYRTLRAVTNLYPEDLHIVVSRDSAVRTVSDLTGRRVSLSELGSGTLTEARLILHSHGLSEQSLYPVYIKPGHAIQAMLEDRLDAFFLVAGYPVSAISRLAAQHPIRLLPIEDDQARKIIASQPYLFRSRIPEGTYPGVAETPTVAVGALLVVNAEMDETLVYRLTETLWSRRSGDILAKGHPKGAAICLERALEGVAIPLHPGARRFYRQAGLPVGDEAPEDEHR